MSLQAKKLLVRPIGQRGHSDTGGAFFEEWAQHWEAELGQTLPVVAWPVQPLVAWGLVTGVIREDLAPLVLRDRGGFPAPSLLPPGRQLRELLASCPEVEVVRRDIVQATRQENRLGKFYTPQEVIDALRSAMLLRDHRRVAENQANRLRCLYLADWQERLRERKALGHQNVGRSKLLQARPQLDVAAMLAYRASHRGSIGALHNKGSIFLVALSVWCQRTL